MANPASYSALERTLHALALLAAFAGKDTIAKYLDQLSRIVAAASDDPAQLEDLTKEIQSMVAEGRDPSADEVQVVRDRRHQLEEEIAHPDAPESPPQ